MAATSAKLVFRNLDCLPLFMSIQLCWNFELYCFYFFPKSALSNWGCGLSTDAAYTWTFTITQLFSFSPEGSSYWESTVFAFGNFEK